MLGSNLDIVIQEKWSELKEDVQHTWTRLTDDELDQIDGDFTVLTGLIQQKYGSASEDIRHKLEELTAEFRREIKEEQSEAAPVPEKTDVSGSLKDQFRQI